jgi:hypothetical protein
MHWRVGNYMLCFGYDFAAQWELANGVVIAKTEINESNNRYILWLGHFGLRLLYCPYPLLYTNLSDWTNCLWITPVYRRWFYTNGNINGSTYSSGNGSCLNISQNGNTINAPIPTLETEGHFPKPGIVDGNLTILINPQTIISLSSPNKRYQFRMIENGNCEFLDMNNLNSKIYTSESYNYII